nr:uncharacterized mitochondrial protein AtMg00810-like [Tanacetum cinerariifolium]
VKGKQENDKIETKPDKNGKRGKAQQCRSPVTVEKAEKRRNTDSRDQYWQILKVVLIQEQRQGLELHFTQSSTTGGVFANILKMLRKRTVYVDDIIFGSTHPRYTQLFSDLMKSRFEMSMMGEMTFFLGLQVNQSPCGIFINQSKYVLEILKKYEMESSDPVVTPMEIKDKLDLDHNGTLVDATKYRSMIGALMYITSSRPDIVHATCLCARYQAKPTKKHLKEVKRIFRYLRGTVNTGIWYTKDSGFELTGFSDADYARCKDSFKSTSGGAQFLGEKLVSWSSKKQDCTAL